MIRVEARALRQVPDVKLMQAAEHPNVRSQSLHSKSDVEVIEVTSMWQHCGDNGEDREDIEDQWEKPKA